MIDKKLSSRYAKALFGICQDRGIDEDELIAYMKGIVQYFRENPLVIEYLSAYVIPYQDKSTIIEQLCENSTLIDFMKYLARKGRFKLFFEISETFEDLIDEKKGRVKAFVKSAIELDEQTKQKLKEQLSKKLRKTVQFEFKTDPDLIAGIIIQVKDVVYDGSLKTYLSNLEQKLMRLSI